MDPVFTFSVTMKKITRLKWPNQFTSKDTVRKFRTLRSAMKTFLQKLTIILIMMTHPITIPSMATPELRMVMMVQSILVNDLISEYFKYNHDQLFS